MTTLQIVLMITVPLLIALIQIWLNIRIRFAKDAAQVISVAKSDASKVLLVLWKILWWLVCVLTAAVIFFQIFWAPWPPDRWSFFIIIWNTFFLLFVISMSWVNRLQDHILYLLEGEWKVLKLIDALKKKEI